MRPFSWLRLALPIPVVLLGFAACADGDPIASDGGGGETAGQTTGAGDRNAGGGGQDGSGGGENCLAAELCDGMDNTCEGDVDEGCDCVEGQTQTCFGGAPGNAGVGECLAGTQICDLSGKYSSVCEGEVLPAVEVCDGLDNDCDSVTDNGFEPETCGLGVCQVTVETCLDGVPQTCTPLQPPDLVEDCDGVDDNCNGTTDEGCACINGQTQPCYSGPMGTVGVGTCAAGVQTCSNGQWGSCAGETTPQTEICDAVDQDCDMNVNEGSCNLANASSSCTSPNCLISSCNSGFSNCDMQHPNGCEVRHTGWSNSAPGEALGSFDADSVYGFLCGSGGSCEGPIVSETGTRGRYYNITANEASDCCAYVAMRFELIVPPGVDYDLHLSGTGCFADPAWQSQGGPGATESIVVYCNDDCGGANNGFNVNVEVRHFSGASCQPYTLNVYRRNC